MFYFSIVFVSELGQGDSYLPAFGPVAFHRVVFETSASRGRTESNIARSPRDPVEYWWVKFLAVTVESFANHKNNNLNIIDVDDIP